MATTVEDPSVEDATIAGTVANGAAPDTSNETESTETSTDGRDTSATGGGDPAGEDTGNEPPNGEVIGQTPAEGEGEEGGGNIVMGEGGDGDEDEEDDDHDHEDKHKHKNKDRDDDDDREARDDHDDKEARDKNGNEDDGRDETPPVADGGGDGGGDDGGETPPVTDGGGDTGGGGDDIHANTAVDHDIDGNPIEHDPGGDFDFPVFLPETAALELLSIGGEQVAFAPEDDVTVQAEGPESAVSLAELAALGGDHMLSEGDLNNPDTDDLTLALGLSESADAAADLMSLLDEFDEPVFDSHANVTLAMSQAEADVLDAQSTEAQADIDARLTELGVDQTEVLSDDDIAALDDNGPAAV